MLYLCHIYFKLRLFELMNLILCSSNLAYETGLICRFTTKRVPKIKLSEGEIESPYIRMDMIKRLLVMYLQSIEIGIKSTRVIMRLESTKPT